MATPEKHGLAKQFTRLIVLSGLASFLLLGFLQVVLNKGLRLYFDQPEVQQQAPSGRSMSFRLTSTRTS